MLRARVLTALGLALLLVVAILLSPPWVTAVVLGLILLIGAWEWSAFLGLEAPWRALYALLLLLLGLTGLPLMGELTRFTWTMLAGAAWWLVALLWIALAPQHVTRIAAA